LSNSRECLGLKGVSAGYSTASAPELDDVTLEVDAGQVVCVLGPNGAGKTTLLRVASGRLPPRSGDVRLLGAPIATRDRAAIARVMAVVEQTQEPSTFSVRDVVAMGRAPHQGTWMRAQAGDAARIDDALARCDLVELAARPMNQLSGGEQKRVAIARALVQEPRVLLLDEPGAFLDVRHQLELYELLAQEVKARDVGCLVVMHDVNLAAQFADRVVLLKKGRIVATGSVAEVLTSSTLEKTFDTELYAGKGYRDGTPFFLPMRKRHM
jgi:iron complex transport system ATP-binding protein